MALPVFRNGKLLEIQVREILDNALPACTLSGVCLFQPDLFVEGRNFGAEIDHLLHFSTGTTDHLLLIECKAQPIQFRGEAPSLATKEWVAEETDDMLLASQSQPPRVELWNDFGAIKADVLLVDEAHDLTASAQTKIREWWQQGNGRRYLILACDRHQRLRLMGENATILEGIPFVGCSTRLTRNYRSPSPIYGAALALMFRWFGRGGTKVLPTERDFADSFGFSSDEGGLLPTKAGETVDLCLKNDSHPANFWSFTVARYTDWLVAYRWIEEWGLTNQQVLWVRFTHTDLFVDQQGLDRVQLRDLQVHNPDQVIDAHIKGREFPVVVIEGLPSEGVDQTNVTTMLAWRRRLYLCASRATCFLFFVYPKSDGSPVSTAWNDELRALLNCCSTPSNRNEGSSKFWHFRFDYPERLLRPVAFSELESANGIDAPTSVPATKPPKLPVASVTMAPALSPMDRVAPSPPSIPLLHAKPETAASSPAVPSATNAANALAPAIAPHKAPSVAPLVPIPHVVAAPTPPRTVPVPPFPRVALNPLPASAIVTPSVSVAQAARPSITADSVPVPALPPKPTTAKPVSTDDQPVLMSERDFQRAYGQEKGWKQFFERYRQTGALPTHRRAMQPKRQNVFAPPKQTLAPATTALKAATTTSKSVGPEPTYFWMTPRMITNHLGVLPFKVSKAALDAFKRRKWNDIPPLDTDLPPEIVREVYRDLKGTLPTGDELRELRAIITPRGVSPKR